ncbi:hypothetical protein [Pseudomonas mosselii]|uniref:hypothetical protein n=1 Tax=Pseudomonas mosselii TaxID=78327 RepID=UPI001F46C526|nr:hypothetical protein [Pseudomonas mosselii]
MRNLYRGFSGQLTAPEQVNIFYNTPRTPKDTHMKIHEAADRWFFEKFGIYARSRALICTTDLSQAFSYGITYQITPEPPSPIVYSTSVRDFLEHQIDLDILTEESIREWLDKMNFKLVHNTSEIDQNFFGEVMVFCEKFRADLWSSAP